MQNNRAAILMYHRIAEELMDPWGLCVSPKNFGDHLAIIRQHFHPIPLPELIKGLQKGNLPDRACVLTFDDGYVDNLNHAMPLLEQYGFPATIFVTTGYTDSKHEFWWDQLEQVFLHKIKLPESLSLTIDCVTQSFSMDQCVSYTDEEYINDSKVRAWNALPGTRLYLYFEVWKILQNLLSSDREVILRQLFEWAEISYKPNSLRRPLTANEIYQLCKEELITIGNHTVNHPPLSAHDEKTQLEEIVESQKALQEIIGQPVSHFAYPHGDYSIETLRLLKETSIESACTVRCSYVHKNTKALELPRCGVTNCASDIFFENLNNYFNT